MGTGSNSPEERFFFFFLVAWAKPNISGYIFHKVENVRDLRQSKNIGLYIVFKFSPHSYIDGAKIQSQKEKS